MRIVFSWLRNPRTWVSGPLLRNRLMGEIGDFILDEYTIIPLFWIPIEATVNPKVVGEYVFAGPFFGNQTHLELVQAAK